MRNEKKTAGVISFISIIVKILSTLLYIPFVISILGEREYGLFNIIGSIIAYIAIIDFGINDSTIRFFVRYKQESSNKKKIKIAGSISSIYYVITALTIISSFAIYFTLNYFFSSTLSPDELIKLKQMYILAIIDVFLVQL